MPPLKIKTHAARVAAFTLLGLWDGTPCDERGANWRSVVASFQRGQRVAADGWYGPVTESKLLPILASIAEKPHPDFSELRPWKLTRYWVQDLRRGSVPMVDKRGRTIASVSAASFGSAALEGTARAPNGDLIEVSAGYTPWSYRYDALMAWASHPRRDYIATGRSRWAGIKMGGDKPAGARRFKIESGWGLGAGYGRGSSGESLVPGLTVAADNGRMKHHDGAFKGRGGPCPAGTRVFVAELAGWDYGSGVSDGWVAVTDTGGGIRGPHFDLFVGSRRVGRTLPERVHVWWDGMDERLPEGYGDQ